MPTESVLAFWGVALLLIVVPGADWAFTISAGLSGRSVVPAVGGIVLGYAGMTAVVAAGVGTVVAASPVALTVLTVVGGGYLVWHGARTLATPSGVDSMADVPPATGWATLARGVGVSGLNPKGLLVFLALLPQFAGPGRAWPVAVQLCVLGVVFMVTCGAFYLALGSVARAVLVRRPAAAVVVSRVAGAGMVAVGVFLVVDRLT
jgi:threonine/homoserine/homoserine lactone efflux protein